MRTLRTRFSDTYLPYQASIIYQLTNHANFVSNWAIIKTQIAAYKAAPSDILWYTWISSITFEKINAMHSITSPGQLTLVGPKYHKRFSRITSDLRTITQKPWWLKRLCRQNVRFHQQCPWWTHLQQVLNRNYDVRGHVPYKYWITWSA